VWQIVAPEPDAATVPGATVPQAKPPADAPAPPTASAEPQWPTQPQWPSHRPGAGGLPSFGRPAQPTGGLESLWAESAREVVATPAARMALAAAPRAATGGVQPCVSCGLSLSATARFCRRCGTRQG